MSKPRGFGMSKPAWLHAIALVTSLGVCTDAAWGQQSFKLRREPGPQQQAWFKLIEPWVSAGGVFGFMRVEDSPQRLLGLDFREAHIGFRPKDDEVSALVFKDTPGSDLATLPTIDRPFGLRFSRADQSVLKAIARQPQLKILDLSQTAVTDAELEMLSGLRFRYLAVGDAAKTDLGLKHYLALLEAAPTRLDLSGWTRLSDAGLKQLAGQAQLKELNLSRTAATDAVGKDLSALSQLQSLNLSRTKITDAGLRELTGLKQLRSLEVGQTALTDVGLQELAKLTQLESLGLWGTKVTDAGMKNLTGLTRLRRLSLINTAVTATGRKELLDGLSLTSLDGRRLDVATPAPPPRKAEESKPLRCEGDACGAISLHAGFGHSCMMMVNKGSKPVKVEYMIHGGKGAATILPGKDARAISPMGCLMKQEQLGTYWATYTEVAPEKKGVQGCIPTASGGCAQPSR